MNNSQDRAAAERSGCPPADRIAERNGRIMTTDHSSVFRDHTLTVLVETELVQCYRLGKPGTGIDSVQLTFTPAGIAIQGDWTPGHYGVVSARNYTARWLARSSGPYLCSKFYVHRFVPAEAIAGLSDPVAAGLVDPDDDDAAAIAEALQQAGREFADGDFGYEGLMERVQAIGLSEPYELWQGYDPADADRLAAIQQAFCRLWRAHMAKSGQKENSG